jgi:outer membrane receptor protein involved in Fe transport
MVDAKSVRCVEPSNSIRRSLKNSGFLSGPDLSRAAKANESNQGFSPCERSQKEGAGGFNPLNRAKTQRPLGPGRCLSPTRSSHKRSHGTRTAFSLGIILSAALALGPVSDVIAAAQSPASATAKVQIAGQIVDQTGAPIPNAQIRDSTSDQILGVTNASGRFTLTCARPCSVKIYSPGFKPTTTEWQSATPIILSACCAIGDITVPPQETVTVTAYRTPLGELESPASTRVLSTQELRQSAAITLDGQLRLASGVETFRRSSSLVANPSSQGLSLRGLGSTSASRTLVTEDDIPLNDAFAGWIHWEELPELSIRSVELVRGGASDLYGSSAIGGVVNVLPVRPESDHVELQSDYGSENTYLDNLLLEGKHGPWGALITGGLLGTDGFIQTAPGQRGSIDTKSNVHAQNGLALLDRSQGPLRLFLRSSVMNEARDNGTPIQKNGTRLWRYASGADWTGSGGGVLTFRAYGGTEHYRQTFSTIAANRDSEVLNRFARTPDNELGAVLHWSQPLLPRIFGPGLLLLAGADTHDVRAADYESVIKSGVLSYVNLSDRQRLTGAYAEILYSHQAWTIAASGRIDWFSNFDGYQWLPSVKKEPRDAERPIDPRLGISRKLGQHFALSGSGFRGFRAPTPNELYRSTQVGSFLTLPNQSLQSERATGWETGAATEQRWGTLRASYFWTRVNHPVTALTTNPNSTPIQLTRENLGQIESRGISSDVALQPAKWMSLEAGYQYTNATVTQYRQQPNLVGNWIPQVAHQMATAQLRGYRPSIGTLSLQGKISGRQFDDDANKYLLHSYFKLDAYASHQFGKQPSGKNLEVFVSGQNLLNRQIEVGRTPTLTLGNPRAVRIGFLLNLGPSTPATH